MTSRHIMVGLLAVLGTFGCSKKDKIKMGDVSVGLNNATKAALTIADLPAGATGISRDGKSPAYSASQFASKMVQIYLNEDVTADGWGNSGEMAAIWINPACPSSEDDDGVRRMGNGGECDTTQITNYFEFARPTDVVNADLNSQKYAVKAGTYRYIRMQLCSSKSTESTLKFSSPESGMTTEHLGRAGFCNPPPVKIDPPLEVGDGDTVVMSIAYDLSTVLDDKCHDLATGTSKCGSEYTLEPNKECAWTDDKSGIRCYDDMKIVPSVSK